MSEFKPSGSEMELSRATVASSTATRSSSSTESVVDDSVTFTSAVRTIASRLLRALPATVTKDANALALKAVMGVATSVGIKTGKTVFARTCRT